MLSELVQQLGNRRAQGPAGYGTDAMILLRRLNGTEIGVNADLFERVESTPDTVLTFIDGTKYIVAEPAAEVVARIVDFRARILAVAESFTEESERRSDQTVPLRLVETDTGRS
jgi:flagellar protein FlbD